MIHMNIASTEIHTQKHDGYTSFLFSSFKFHAPLCRNSNWFIFNRESDEFGFVVSVSDYGTSGSTITYIFQCFPIFSVFEDLGVTGEG